VYKTSALLVTHRLQDAFTLASHYYDPASKHMKPTDGAPSRDIHTSFMILHEGKVIFQGTAHELGKVEDPYIKEYIS
jgi:phospholipid/cholesterol/gamma-HCH transport system ATP-binding protein